jgi:hypothetical protein
VTYGPGDPQTWPAYAGHPNDPRAPLAEDCVECCGVGQVDDGDWCDCCDGTGRIDL